MEMAGRKGNTEKLFNNSNTSILLVVSMGILTIVLIVVYYVEI